MVRVLVNKPLRIGTMQVVTDTDQRISMNSTPVRFGYQSSATIGSVERQGKKKLSRMLSPGTPSLSFSNTVSSLDWHTSIEPTLRSLKALGDAGRTIRFIGASELEQANWWTITSMSINVLQRTPKNEISRAEISWQVVEAVDVTGELFRTTTKTVVDSGLSNVITNKSAPQRLHTVVPGETLFQIAARYMNGDGARWPEIWNLNRDDLPNPNLLTIGRVLKIPGS